MPLCLSVEHEIFQIAAAAAAAAAVMEGMIKIFIFMKNFRNNISINIIQKSSISYIQNKVK